MHAACCKRRQQQLFVVPAMELEMILLAYFTAMFSFGENAHKHQCMRDGACHRGLFFFKMCPWRTCLGWYGPWRSTSVHTASMMQCINTALCAVLQFCFVGCQ